MEIGGYKDVLDWPKMGPSLLIATCLIVAIRTAKWSATIDARNSNCELDKEIDFAANAADRVLAVLTSKSRSIFRAENSPGTERPVGIIRSEPTRRIATSGKLAEMNHPKMKSKTSP